MGNWEEGKGVGRKNERTKSVCVCGGGCWWVEKKGIRIKKTMFLSKFVGSLQYFLPMVPSNESLHPPPPPIKKWVRGVEGRG